jgi:hypothetical protein
VVGTCVGAPVGAYTGTCGATGTTTGAGVATGKTTGAGVATGADCGAGLGSATGAAVASCDPEIEEPRFEGIGNCICCIRQSFRQSIWVQPLPHNATRSQMVVKFTGFFIFIDSTRVDQFIIISQL